MMKYSYHNHTYLCEHSEQKAEEIVKLAIAKGMKTIGLSEHEPVRNKDWNWALKSHEEMEIFLDTVESLKEKYKGQIKILSGLEIEPREPGTGIRNIEWVMELQKNPRVQYVVMGHHYFRSGGSIFNYKPTDEELKHYLEDLDEGLEKIKPLYLAHPDGLTQGNGIKDENGVIEPRIIEVWKEIIRIAIKHNTPLGVNMLGLYKKKNHGYNPGYTNLSFYKLAAEMGAKAHIEADTHAERHWDEEIYNEAMAIVKESGIELAEELA